MQVCDAFLQRARFRELLRPFDEIHGVLYILKDAESRVMAISPASIKRMGYSREEDILGRTMEEYLPKELAEKFRADDLWVLEHGEPKLNMVEMWFSPQGKRDWIVTSKYPIRNEAGTVIGVMGILQNLGTRQKRLSDLGPVGKAVDYIRARLGETLMVPDVATSAGISERQLQRLFRRVLGQTIQQYIIASRVHAAAYDLTHSERSIAEIALSYGFNDQSAFSNSFRNVTGLAPRAYRQRMSKG